MFTPSRRVGGKRVVCYDDRFIVKLAFESDGIVVSNDTYRDLQGERQEWKRFIEERLLMYSFVNDKYVPDSAGRCLWEGWSWGNSAAGPWPRAQAAGPTRKGQAGTRLGLSNLGDGEGACGTGWSVLPREHLHSPAPKL